MTTEVEVYALEDGDIIVYRGNMYTYLDTQYVDGTSVDVLCVDEEGYRKAISVPNDTCILHVLVLDNSEAVV